MWRKSTRNGKEERQSAKGRHVITLNLAITLRVTLAGIFKIPFHPPYTYCLENLFLYKTGYRVPFETRLFSYKEICNTISIIDLE